MSKLSKILNWRLIILHLIALWLFYYGAEILAFLYDRPLADSLWNAWIRTRQKPGSESDQTFIEQIGNIALVVAYVLSWWISSKKGWHWINGVIAFVVVFALGYFNSFGWEHLSSIILMPGSLFDHASIWSFIVCGSFMLVLGSLILFWRKIQAFIDRGAYVDQEAIAADKKKRRVR